MHQPHRSPEITFMTVPPRKPVMGHSLTHVTPLSQCIAHTQKHYPSWQFTCTKSLQTQPDLPSPCFRGSFYNNRISKPELLNNHWPQSERVDRSSTGFTDTRDCWQQAVTTTTSAKRSRQGKDSGITHYSHTANPCQPAQPHTEQQQLLLPWTQKASYSRLLLPRAHGTVLPLPTLLSESSKPCSVGP